MLNTTPMSHSPANGSSSPASATDSSFQPNARKSRPTSLNTAKSSRRQSSISYLPPDSERHWRIRSPTAAASESESGSPTATPALSRSVSLSSVPQSKLKEARRTSFDPRNGGTAAHTLAEKCVSPSFLSLSAPLKASFPNRHADLLHFIAQKESKCLELRSQLASHEAELLQLKQRWERIVNRDFGKALSSAYSPSTAAFTSPTTTPSTPNSTQHPQAHSSNGASALSTNHGNGAVFDGFVEGMQGVGRLIAAGLSSPVSSSSAASSPVAPSSSLRGHARSSSSAKSSMLGRRLANGHGHAAHMSTSSTSTAATGSTSMSGSTRLSQSSASSLGLGDEPILGVHKEESDSEGGGQELMVRDTGATPTLSPNPSFVRRHSTQSQHSTPSSPLSISPPSTGLATSKLLRRRSRDAPPLVSLEETDSEMKSQDVKTPKKRTSVNGLHSGAVPTPTSIPGIGSLSAMGAQGWVGSVGKKFEDLQNGKTYAFPGLSFVFCD